MPPLLAYHAVILVGAFALVYGVERSVPDLVPLGIALIVLGIAIALALLVWAARSTLDAPGPVWDRPPPAAPSGPPRQYLCPSCGWKGSSAGYLCPRCQRPVARLR